MAGDIEFLPEEFADESPAELEPRQPRTPWPPWWRAVALGVAFLAFVAWIASRPSGTAAPKATPLTSRTVTAPASTSAPAVAAEPVRINSHVVTCPTGVPVQTDIRRAMRRYLPTVVVTYPMSYECNRGVGIDERIVFESVRGWYRGLVITVELTTPLLDGFPSFNAAPPSGALVQLGTVHSQSPGLKVEIAVSGHSNRPVPYDQVQRLAMYLGQNIRL